MAKRLTQTTLKSLSKTLETRVLVIQDEGHLLDSIARRLAVQGYLVDIARDGEEGYQLALTRRYPIIILEILLPKKDGMFIIKELRRNKIDSMLLVLSEKTIIEDRVDALRAGADDYLIKPFAFMELIARIEALLRRYHPGASPLIKVGDLELDTMTRYVRRANKNVRLTEKQFLLLEFLLRNKNRTVSRQEIAEQVWGYDFDPGTRIVDVYIKHLRAVIDTGFPRRLIYTVRGAGFIIKED